MSQQVETTNAKPQEDWMARRWRPMMGWMYMVVCTFDFVVAPVLWAFLQAKMGQPVSQWKPLTLEGAGLFHMAMGAVLGVAAYGRTQEKLGGANNGGLQPPYSSPGTASPSTGFNSGTSGAGFSTGGIGTNSTTNSGASFVNGGGSSTSTSNFGEPTSTFGFGDNTVAEVTTGFGGKKAPPPITNFPER